MAAALRRGPSGQAGRLPVGDGGRLGRGGSARQGGAGARAAQRLPAPEHAGRGHALRQLRELSLPLPWLDLRSRRQVHERAAAGGAA